MMDKNALGGKGFLRAQLNADGGSRGNPGPSGIGFTIAVDNGNKRTAICRGGAYIGRATNNIAEYSALIWGLENALALGVQKLDIQLDSELLVKQLKGEYRVKNEGLRPLFSEALQLLKGFDSYSMRHIPRELNSEADKLANEAMDTQGPVGDYVYAYDMTRGPLSCQVSTEEPDKRAAPLSHSTGTYKLTVKSHFDAAHALVGYPGECRSLHGHTWDIEVTIQGTQLDEVGIVYDFKDLKANLAQILSQYDHAYLNEVAPFDSMNATAENLARVIYEQMEEMLPENIDLAEVAVWESPIARLSYSK